MKKTFLMIVTILVFWPVFCFAQKSPDVKVLRDQAGAGDISAAVQLAKYYKNDKKDIKKAEEWFYVSALAGDAEAQYHLARIYDDSREGKHPNKEVVEWLQKSAAQGYLEAQIELGKIYQFGRRGIPKDHVKAKNWYEMAAAKGSKSAMLQLEKMYQSSKQGSYTKVVQKDDNLAWLDTAAKQGSPEASLRLAILLEKGLGVPKDVKRAFKLYSVAAGAGIPEGMAGLGTMYANGNGIDQNYKYATMWLEKAGIEGYVEAQRKLAEIYSFKEVNKVKAYGWLVVSLSAMFPYQSNLVSVSPDLERLLRSMTKEEVASGQKYALDLVEYIKESRKRQEQKQIQQMEEMKKYQVDPS